MGKGKSAAERLVKVCPTGVESVVGLPGSGKSFFAVGTLLDAILKGRRPVFTNLPLQWRVVRKYLKDRGGSEYADLVYPLDDNGDHWRRFLRRNAERQAFYASFRAEHPNAQYSVIEKEWIAKAGENVLRGPQANWITATALIIIDEAHRWIPSDGAERITGSEYARDLVTYFSMLRHHLHRCDLLTQRVVNIHVTARRMIQTYWFVRDKGEDKLAWGVRFKHIGVKAFGYVKVRSEQVNRQGDEWEASEDAPVGENYTVLPWLPSQRWKFRLYRSFTHVGSVRRLKRDLLRARQEAGLTDDGSLNAEPVSAREVELKRIKAFAKVVGMVSVLGAGFLVGVPIGFIAGGGKGEAASAPVAEAEPREWGAWRSYGADWMRVGDQVLRQGRATDGVTLLAVSGVLKRALLHADGGVWVWQWGEPAPVRAADDGPAAVAFRAVRDAARAEDDAGSGRAGGHVGGRAAGSGAGDAGGS